MLNVNNEIKLAILMRIDSKITRDQLAFSLSFGVDKKLKIKLLYFGANSWSLGSNKSD